MTTTALTITTPTELPKKFYRGQILAFTMELPEKFQPGDLAAYVPTAQLRRLENSGPAGLIAELTVDWVADTGQTELSFLFDEDTSEWPLGPAVFDVLFTASPTLKIRSAPVEILIVNGVTA